MNLLDVESMQRGLFDQGILIPRSILQYQLAMNAQERYYSLGIISEVLQQLLRLLPPILVSVANSLCFNLVLINSRVSSFLMHFPSICIEFFVRIQQHARLKVRAVILWNLGSNGVQYLERHRHIIIYSSYKLDNGHDVRYCAQLGIKGTSLGIFLVGD